MGQINTRSAILKVLAAFMRKTGMSASRLGYLSIGDPNFIRDFQQGKRDPRLSTLERVLRYVQTYKPND